MVGETLLIFRAGRSFEFRAAPGGPSLEEWRAGIARVQQDARGATGGVQVTKAKAPTAAELMQRAAKEIARGADFRELAGAGCKIPKTEERAITLKQLVAVMANIKRRCEAEG